MMAEAVAAVGAVSSFLQIVQFTAKVVSTTHRVISGKEDALRENIEIERLTREHESLVSKFSAVIKAANENGEHKDLLETAQACQREAENLLKELEGLRVDARRTGARRFIEGSRKAIHALNRRKEIDSRRKQLNELNSIYATHLLQELWQKEHSTVSFLIRDPFERKGTRSVDDSCFLAPRYEMRHILRKLLFPEIFSREEAIDLTWQKTYQWALENPSVGFEPWLRRGNGVFWISGKAGSGKSTLMKYLFHAKGTRAALREWSEHRSLVTARYYFWYGGTLLQKSTTGLFMSILYQLLNDTPSLAQVAFPEHSTASAISNLTHDDYLQALQRIAGCDATQGADMNSKFCFFIDGLDEYDGRPHQLVQILNDLASHKNIKLCVASREWNPFREAYETRVPQLRVEDLSKADITTYVSDHIHNSIQTPLNTSSSPSAEIDQLIHEIVAKAEGVFLWVMLVVKSVCEGLAEGDNIAFLRYRVEQFPADLEDFFRLMLRRIDPIYKHQTYQAIKLAWLVTSHRDKCYGNTPDSNGEIASSFIDYWLIRQRPTGLQDTTFAIEGKIETVSHYKLEERIKETRTFLAAATKDLLCIPWHSMPSSWTQVQFLHRTVYDFLRDCNMQDLLDANVPMHFKDGRILHLLNLKRLKHIRHRSDPDRFFDMLTKSVNWSLSTRHPDLNKQYVHQFASLVLHVHNTFSSLALWEPKPAVITTLIAFNEHHPHLIFDHLRKYSWESETLSPAEPSSGNHPVWRATFGESDVNPFPFCEVDPMLVRRLFNCANLGLSWLQHSSNTCDNSAWQAFLRGWKLADPLLHERHCGRSSALRNVWIIAELFLENGAPLSQKFCLRNGHCDDSDHMQHTYDAKDHIRMHVPEDWLSESTVFLRCVKVSQEWCSGT